jgi:hypothetical protein
VGTAEPKAETSDVHFRSVRRNWSEVVLWIRGTVRTYAHKRPGRDWRRRSKVFLRRPSARLLVFVPIARRDVFAFTSLVQVEPRSIARSFEDYHVKLES